MAMITVAILINGQPITARSASRKGKVVDNKDSDLYRYAVDDGSFIRHRQKDGAVKLAIEMLKTIK